MENKDNFNDGICICGHHSKDHSYSLAPNCTDLECNKCNCQNYTARSCSDKELKEKIKQKYRREWAITCRNVWWEKLIDDCFKCRTGLNQEEINEAYDKSLGDIEKFKFLLDEKLKEKKNGE